VDAARRGGGIKGAFSTPGGPIGDRLFQMRRHQFPGELDNRVYVPELYLFPPGVRCRGPQSGGSAGALGEGGTGRPGAASVFGPADAPGR